MPHIAFLPNIVYLLAASVIVVAIFRHLKLNPVLGYFVAGSLLGPSMLNIVNPEDLTIFGEFGVVFLLFAIGLELTFDRLKAMRLYVFGMGTAQVVLTGMAVGLVVLAIGHTIPKSFLIGFALALSSTAIVLQVIAETRTQSTQVGRLALAILLLQDFAVVPLLVIVPMLSTDPSHGSSIANLLMAALGKAILALALIFVIGRSVLKPFFAIITADNAAKNNEIFVSTTLLIALAAAFVTEQLGLSLALGAFVAGLLVAETSYQHQAEESIAPFKGIFLGLFFMTVGMNMDFNFIADNYEKILGFSLLLVVIKALIITGLCLLFKFNLATSLHTGLLLSQGGEFAFILFKLAQDQHVITKMMSQTLMMTVTTTMALTPLLSYLGSLISRKLDSKPNLGLHYILKQTSDLDNHVIVIGFGRVGKMVARILEAESIHFVGIDNYEEAVSEAKADNFPIYLGDATHLKVLEVLGLERAQSVIISVNDEELIYKCLKIIRNKYSLPVIVRYRDMSAESKLKEAGATVIVPETYETGLQLGGAVLKTLGVSEYEVSRLKNRFRAGNYLYAKQDDEA